MGKGTQTSTTTNSPPQDVLDQYNYVTGLANNVAQTPYQPYNANLVAGMNNQQSGAIANMGTAGAEAGGAYGTGRATSQDALGLSSAAQGTQNVYQPYFDQAEGNLGQANNLVGGAGTTLGSASGMIGAGAAGLGQAANYYSAGAGGVNPGTVGAGQIAQYMSPYQNSVIQSTMAEANQANQQQAQGAIGSAIASGNAFGGDRMGLGLAALANQQGMAENSTLANLNNTNYTQALGEANNQQQIGLAAQEQNRALQMQAAQGYAGLGAAAGVLGSQQGQIGVDQGNLAGVQNSLAQTQAGMGTAAQNNQLNSINASNSALQTANQSGSLMNSASGSALAAANAQLAGGTLQQQTQQNVLNAAYQQFQNQIAFPYQQTGWLGNISEGIGSNSGGTSTTTSPAPFFSDKRLKSDAKIIGKTKDGQNIYRFRYKGDKDWRIGLMAQDVLKKHPEAVSKHQGFLAVDYKKATDKAAGTPDKRGKFASGGVPDYSGVSIPGSDVEGVIPPPPLQIGGGGANGIPKGGMPQQPPDPLETAIINKGVGVGIDQGVKEAGTLFKPATSAAAASPLQLPGATLGAASAAPAAASTHPAAGATAAADAGAAGLGAAGLGMAGADAASMGIPTGAALGMAGAGAAGAADAAAFAPLLLLAKRGGRIPKYAAGGAPPPVISSSASVPLPAQFASPAASSAPTYGSVTDPGTGIVTPNMTIGGTTTNIPSPPQMGDLTNMTRGSVPQVYNDFAKAQGAYYQQYPGAPGNPSGTQNPAASLGSAAGPTGAPTTTVLTGPGQPVTSVGANSLTAPNSATIALRRGGVAGYYDGGSVYARESDNIEDRRSDLSAAAGPKAHWESNGPRISVNQGSDNINKIMGGVGSGAHNIGLLSDPVLSTTMPTVFDLPGSGQAPTSPYYQAPGSYRRGGKADFGMLKRASGGRAHYDDGGGVGGAVDWPDYGPAIADSVGLPPDVSRVAAQYANPMPAPSSLADAAAPTSNVVQFPGASTPPSWFVRDANAANVSNFGALGQAAQNGSVDPSRLANAPAPDLSSAASPSLAIDPQAAAALNQPGVTRYADGTVTADVPTPPVRPADLGMAAPSNSNDVNQVGPGVAPIGAPVTLASAAPTTGSGFLSSLQHFESGNRNIPNTTQGTTSGQAQGFNQITTGTWNEFAPKAGIDLDKYPTPISAPLDVQNQVAATIPMGRWAPETLNYLKAQGYSVNPSTTLGQNIADNGGSSGQSDTASGYGAPAASLRNASGVQAINAASPQGATLGSAAQPANDNSSKGGLFGTGITVSEPMQMALLKGVFGMLASPSHTLAGAIGSGGVAGVDQYMASQQLTRQNALAQSEIAKNTLGMAQQRFTPRVDANGNLSYFDSMSGATISPAQHAQIIQQAMTPSASVPSVAPQTALQNANATAGAAPQTAPVPASGGSSATPAPVVQAPVTPAATAPAAPNDPVAAAQQAADANPTVAKYTAAMQQKYAQADQLDKLAQANTGINEQAAQRYATQANAARMQGQAFGVQASQYREQLVKPAIAGAEAQGRANVELGTAGPIAASKATAESTAKAPFELQEVQDTPGGPTRYVPKSQLLGIQKNNPDATAVGLGAGSPPGSSVDAAAAANPAVAKQPAFYAAKQEAIAKNEDDMLAQMQARQLSKQRLQTLQGIMQAYQPGAFAEQKADIVAGLRGVGIPVKDSDTANPAQFQEFIKNATANVFNDVKGMGGRVLVSEIQGLTKANANPELQPQAAAAIIGQGLGVINYEDQHAQDYFDWKHQKDATGNQPNMNTVDTSTFELPWLKSHSPGQYVDEATKGIAYKGQTVPANPSDRAEGQTYLTPKGPFTWTKNGWQRPQ